MIVWRLKTSVIKKKGSVLHCVLTCSFKLKKIKYIG
jgi:hypothetical protein